jgi:energy-coupling factor transporter ATP-binding protein EcfA2
MNVNLTVKNYRCFPDERPLRLALKPGFTSFIGTNNSGKSSILRLFYEFRDLFNRLRDLSVLVALSRGAGQSFSLPESVSDANDLYCNGNGRDLELEFEFSASEPTPSQFLRRFVIGLKRGTANFAAKATGNAGVMPVHNDNIQINPTTVRGGDGQVIDFAEFIDAMSVLTRMLYIGPFRNVINTGTNQSYFDIQVGQSFVKTWREYKTGPVKSNNESILKLTSDIQNIFGFRYLEVNPSPADDTLQIFIDGRSYRINEVGSGLAQFVIVLANAAIKRPTFILIDEPELSLHPSLQLDFLTTLTSYASDGVMFSTHNMGLARAASDRVYALRRESQGHSEVYSLESIPRLSEFVGELSFSGYQELGFDRILLVEGPTEVRTIQQFLRLIKKEHRVILLPLGGSSLINGVSELELLEVKRISAKVSAIIDSERSSAGEVLSNERENFRKTCLAAKIGCHVLERRATENYFSESAIKRAVGNQHTALSAYERLHDRQSRWNKSQNWKIAREMTLPEIEGTDLKAFLDTL